MASSAISFIYFQFYFEKCFLFAYTALIILTAVRSASCLHVSESRFPFLCLGSMLLSLIPVAHAAIWSSGCRFPMIGPYIVYCGLCTLGGACYIFRVLGRSREVTLHASSLAAAIWLFNVLLNAKTSNVSFVRDECRSFLW
jgi:hypothetical protein